MNSLLPKSFYVVLLLLTHITILVGQKRTQLESLETVFSKIERLVAEKEKFPEEFLNIEYLTKKAKNAKGEERVLTLLRLFKANIYKNTSEAKYFNDQAHRLADSLRFTLGILKAGYNEAYLKFVKGDFDDAMGLLSTIENDVNLENYTDVYADFYTLKSDVFSERGEYDKALETGLHLLGVAENTGNEYQLMRAYAALSHYYLRIEDFAKALDYCLKGLEYIIKLKQTEYLFPKIDEIGRMTAKLNNSGQALKAYEFYSKLEKELSPPGDYIQSIVYMNMADIFTSTNEYDKAQHFLSQAIEMNYEHDYNFRIPRALILQAELDLKKKDTANAISNYEKSIDAAEHIDAFDVVKNNSAVLIDLFENTHQPLKVTEYKKLYNMINDSLFTSEKEQKIIILEARRRIKEITDKQRILEIENEAQKSRERNILVALLFFLILSGVTTYSYIKVKNKNKLLYNRTIELAEMQLSLEKEKHSVTDMSHNSLPKKVKKNSDRQNQAVIDEDVKNIILAKLTKLENENFFLDSTCSLHQLSEMLKTNPKYLSQVINQEKKSNFNNYINELRITYLLSKLLKDKEFRNSKLSYIAVSIGFNNLNTFNSAFKKRQGILPSYFIKKLNEEENHNIRLDPF